MNRILLTSSAIVIATLSAACGSSSDSSQSDGVANLTLDTKVPADQVDKTLSEFYAPYGGSACYPRTCSVGAPDSDGNVVIYASEYCANLPPGRNGVCIPNDPVFAANCDQGADGTQ